MSSAHEAPPNDSAGAWMMAHQSDPELFRLDEQIDAAEWEKHHSDMELWSGVSMGVVVRNLPFASAALFEVASHLRDNADEIVARAVVDIDARRELESEKRRKQEEYFMKIAQLPVRSFEKVTVFRSVLDEAADIVDSHAARVGAEEYVRSYDTP